MAGPGTAGEAETSPGGPDAPASGPTNGTVRRRPGRRPGTADTRGEILAAARRMFAEKGFDRTTIRGIAREASVDPALVHHYFANKEGIFVAAMQLPLDPAVVIPTILSGPREEIGRRLATLVLTVTADARAREPVMALIRTATTNEQAVVMIREFISGAILGRVGQGLGVPPIRMEAAFAQLFGVVMMRYIVKLEPLASVPVEEVVDLIAPTIQRYIDGG